MKLNTRLLLSAAALTCVMVSAGAKEHLKSLNAGFIDKNVPAM